MQSLGYAGVSASDGKITKETIQDPDYSRHITMGWNYRMQSYAVQSLLLKLKILIYL